MKPRTFYSAIAIFVGVLLLVGGIGFWGLTAQNPRSLLLKGGQEIPMAAQFVPRQAPVMVSLLARPDRLWQLRQLLTPSSQRFVARQEWQTLQQGLNDFLGWDYDTNVRPWLGEEVSFAVTTSDLDHNADNGLQAGYLAVLTCRDVAAAQEALHLLWQQRAAAGRNLVFKSISGISVIYDQPLSDTPFPGLSSISLKRSAPATLASAIIGQQYVLLANDPAVLQQALATYQAPDVSLAQAANYRDSIRSLPPERIGWLYANLPNTFTWLGLDATASPPLSTEGQAASFVFTSFRAFPEGLLGDTAIAAAPGQSLPSRQPTAFPATAAIRWLPPETLFATAGSNLSEVIQDLGHTIGGYTLTQRVLEGLLESLALPTATLPDDLVSSLKGDYVLGTLEGSTPTWVLMTQATDPEPLDSFDTFVQSQGINVSQVELGDRTITAWTRIFLSKLSPTETASLRTQVVGVHTNIDGYEVLANSLSGLQQILGNLEISAQSTPTPFVELLDHLPLPVGNLVYINWPQLAPVLTNRLPWLRVIEQAGQPLTSHIGPVAVSGNGSRESSQKGGIAIKLVESS
jgi:hypothetical protein